MVFERLREILQKNKLPPEAGRLLEGAESTEELLSGLDSLVTRNEVAVNKLNEELAALEQLEAREREKIRTGSLGPRTRASVLRRILRLRQQMDHIEDRLQIHDRNIRLHLDLIGVLKQIEAMAMAGVSEKEVDRIVLRFTEELKEYQASLLSSEVLARRTEEVRVPLEVDLTALETEILTEAAASGAEGAERTEEPEAAEPGGRRGAEAEEEEA